MNIPMTKKELSSFLRTYGFLAKYDGDEIEVYPKGQRGEKSYFTDCRHDALETAKTEFCALVRSKVQNLLGEENMVAIDAIGELAAENGTDWKEKLETFFSQGRRPYCWDSYEASAMQKLRNHDNRAFDLFNL